MADAAFPPQCLQCRGAVQSAGALCAACFDTVGFISAPYCALCGTPFETPVAEGTLCAGCIARRPAFAAARSAVHYESARELVLRLKHADRLDTVPSLAGWMRRAGADVLARADAIVPVPLHRWRLLSRRYNQSAELARALGRISGLPVLTGVLIRTRATKSQGVMASARARRRNVLGAFAVPERLKAQISGLRLLLIDDVMTTGATLEACARALTRAGAQDVLALTLARVVRGGPDAL